MAAEPRAEAPIGIQVLAIASPPHELVELAIGGISRLVAVPCRLADAPCALEIPRVPGRDQADADQLLARVEACPRPPGHWTVGLVAEDIGHPIFTFFFGRARHYGGAALVSLARLDPSFYGLASDAALTARAKAYMEVLSNLHAQDAWDELNEEQQARIEGPLKSRAEAEVPSGTGIPFLRSELSA